MIKSNRTSIVCNKYNFEKEVEEREKNLAVKLGCLIKITSDIADELKKSSLGKKIKKRILK